MLHRHNFKIGFNANYQKTPELRWRVAIDNVEHLISDFEIDSQPVKAIEHKMPSGEHADWSIYCEALHYRIDSRKKLFIY